MPNLNKNDIDKEINLKKKLLAFGYSFLKYMLQLSELGISWQNP